MPRLTRWFASIGSGLALWACYPPLDAGWLVPVALVPLLLVLWGAEPMTARRAFGHGYVAGVVFSLLSFKWLWHVAGPAVVLLALYLGVYLGAWGAFVAAMGRPRPQEAPLAVVARMLGISAAWTGLEWLRGIVFTGFGWNGLGVALHNAPVLAGEARWIGVTGLSFWIALINAAVAVTLAIARSSGTSRDHNRRALLAPLLVGAIIGALYAAPTWWLARARARPGGLVNPGGTVPLRVALIQPNIPQEVKNLRDQFDPIARSLARLTLQAAATEPPPSLIVWPESALPSTIDDPGVVEFIDQTLQLGDFALALGIDEQLMDRFFNSVAVARGNAASVRVHAKIHLVPFGEFLPLRGVLGKIDWLHALVPGDFDTGESAEPMVLPDTGVGMIPLVCFEDTISRVARKFVRPGPQLIVNVTNDAWFRDSEGADQHLANAVFRCLELDRPMIRAANTGVTAVINARGEVADRLPRLREGVLNGTVAVAGAGHPLTFYARHGDILPPILLGLAGASAVWLRLRRTREPRLPHPSDSEGR